MKKLSALMAAMVLLISGFGSAEAPLVESEDPMANIPQVKVGSTVYNLKDAEAREQISNLKSAFNANIDEKIDLVENSYFSNYESFGDDDPQARRTTYIPVIPGEIIKTCSRANQNVYEIAFFDIGKNFDKQNSILGDTNINTREITVPANDYYLIISAYNPNYKETICFARKTSKTEMNYTGDAIGTFLIEQKHTVSNSGGYHNSANMSFVSDASGKSTDFIPVYPGQVIKYSTHINNLGFELIYYSEYKFPLMSVSIIGDNSETEKEVTVPQYARYAKLWSYGSYKAYIKIGKAQQQSDDYFAYNGGYNTFAIFRKFVVCGDSLSVGHIDYGDSHTTPNLDYCWGQYIARDYNSECVNCGASGLSAETWLTNANGLAKMQARGNKGQAYIIGLGANEQTGNIGSPETLDDQATFYGAYKAIYDAIRALNPTAKIFMFTLPTHWGDEWNAVNEGIRYIAESIGDTSTFLVDFDRNYSQFFSSFPIDQTQTTHYLPDGYKLISKVIEYALDNIIVNNPSAFGNIHLIPYDPVDVFDTSTTLENLKSGTNAIFIAEGTVIGDYTIPNNCRGYAIKDGNNINGFVTTYDATKYIILGNNGADSWQFAVEH